MEENFQKSNSLPAFFFNSTEDYPDLWYNGNFMTISIQLRIDYTGR